MSNESPPPVKGPEHEADQESPEGERLQFISDAISSENPSKFLGFAFLAGRITSEERDEYIRALSALQEGVVDEAKLEAMKEKGEISEATFSAFVELKKEEPQIPETEVSRFGTGLVRSENPSKFLGFAFLAGRITSEERDEYSRVLVAIHDGVIDRAELESLRENGQISEETFNRLARFEPKSEPAPAKSLEDLREEFIAEASALKNKYQGGDIPPQELQALRSRFDALYPSGERRVARDYFISRALSEAESENEAESNVRAEQFLDVVALLYPGREAILGRHTYRAYQFLYRNAGASIRHYGGLPPSTVTNINMLRQKLSFVLSQAPELEKQKRHELIQALHAFNHFMLIIPGWQNEKEQIFLERAIENQTNIFAGRAEDLFPSREKVIANLEKNIVETERFAEEALREALHAGSPVMVENDLKRIKYQITGVESKKRQLEALRSSGIETENPLRRRKYIEGLAYIEMAFNLEKRSEQEEVLLSLKKNRLANFKEEEQSEIKLRGEESKKLLKLREILSRIEEDIARIEKSLDFVRAQIQAYERQAGSLFGAVGEKQESRFATLRDIGEKHE